METVKMTVVSDAKASRLELLVRLVWGTVVGFVLGLIGMFMGVLVTIQWFHILFLGQRQAGIQRLVNAYGVAVTQLKFYLMLATDERPSILPEF